MTLSTKAQRQQLRERLLHAGTPYAEIAAAMCRTFAVRPRTGWRYAVGWEMRKLAEELLAANPRARVDKTRISRWESWPIGVGSTQPSLHDLAGLAMAFGHGCTVADLVDQADLAELSPPERRLIASIASTETARNAEVSMTGSPVSIGGPAVSFERHEQTSDSVMDAVPKIVGTAGIVAMNTMAEAFAHTDHQLGGGHAAATVSHYLQHSVYPTLSENRDGSIELPLQVAAGRLHNVAGFMAFDADRHGVAERHFSEALILARTADDDALTAHVLGDMTMHAIYVGSLRRAIELSDGAVDHAKRTKSPRILARAYALSARARASSSDAAGADAMMARSERLMDRAPLDNDPAWIQFFSTTQLQTEFLYTAAALGRLREVDRLAPAVLVTDATMQRRHVLAGAAIAGALTRASGREAAAEPEQAVQVLTQILPTARRLSSPRSLASVVAVRAQLARFGTVGGLDELDHALTREIII